MHLKCLILALRMWHSCLNCTPVRASKFEPASMQSTHGSSTVSATTFNGRKVQFEYELSVSQEPHELWLDFLYAVQRLLEVFE
jgi:hypothetical protein